MKYAVVAAFISPVAPVGMKYAVVAAFISPVAPVLALEVLSAEV